MNRSKIEWCDHTWNPITGCLHGCPYCYARIMTVRFTGDLRMNKMAKDDYRVEVHNGKELYILDEQMINEKGSPIVYPFGFAPTYHRYRLNTLDKLKMGNNIFVGAMADLFGEWVPWEWTEEILDVCCNHPEHNYLFLTKNPNGYITHPVRTIEQNNMFYGMSVTKECELEERISGLPKRGKKFVSIEPILEDIHPNEHMEQMKGLDWIIIGAETGVQRKKAKVVPEFEWIKDIVLAADSLGIPVFMKDSLVPIVGEQNMRREYPKELMRKTISPKMEKKLFDICYRCGKRGKKTEMVTLFAKTVRRETPKAYGYMCKKCFKDDCKEKGIEIPKLTGLEE